MLERLRHLRACCITASLAWASACGGGDATVAPLGGPGDGGGGGDGSTAPADGASPDGGTIPTTCGDKKVDYANGEECDDGNSAPNDGCDPSCKREKPTTCADGKLDLANGEQCDDGNTAPNDGCSATCQFEPLGKTCGNTTKEALEVCDDGNTANGDACNPTCNLANDVTLFAGTIGGGAFGNAMMAADQTSLWIVDETSFRVRRIDVATTNVTTVAGTGVTGVVDNPNGSAAQFAGLSSVATDGVTVWVTGSNRVRAIAVAPPHGTTTLAGTGAAGSNDGAGLTATFSDPRGLTYYAGLLYLVDVNNSTLRTVDPKTGEVKTIAGQAGAAATVDGVGTAARFVSPRYIASDNSGMLYIVDNLGYTIRSYNTVTGAVATFAGNATKSYSDGTGTAAGLHRPRGITSDGTSLYWVEFEQHTVRQAVLATGSVTTLAGKHCNGQMPCAGGSGNGTGTAAQLTAPWSVVYHFPTKSLFVSDGGNDVIRRIR